MKLHFPDGNGGVNTIEVSDNISIYIENELTDWTLATASKTTKGGIKVGDGLYMTGESLNATPYIYTLPTASESVKGGVKVGDGLYMTGETLNATPYIYTLPTASESIKGGVKVGNGLYMDGETLNVTLFTAGDGTVSGDGKLLYADDDGGTKGLEPGDGLTLDGNTLKAVPHYTIPTGQSGGGGSTINTNNIMYVTEEGDVSVLNLGDQFYIEGNTLQVQMFNVTIDGGTTENNSLVYVNNEGNVSNVVLGDNFYVQNNVLNYSIGADDYKLPVATDSRLGGVKVGDGLEITRDGVLSCTLTAEAVESLIPEITGTTTEQRFLRVNILESPPANPVPPYCCRNYSSSWGVDPVNPGVPSDPNIISSQYGALVLEKIFMDIDFKVYGDNGQEILLAERDRSDFQSEHSSTNTSPYESGSIGQNVAGGKKLVSGTTVVPLTDRMFDYLAQGYIYIEWGTESEMGNVKFIGAYFGALPDSPKNGRLAYMNNSFYLYDGSTKKWLKWQVSAD